jgi:hypothetical protein
LQKGGFSLGMAGFLRFSGRKKHRTSCGKKRPFLPQNALFGVSFSESFELGQKVQ